MHTYVIENPLHVVEVLTGALLGQLVHSASPLETGPWLAKVVREETAKEGPDVIPANLEELWQGSIKQLDSKQKEELRKLIEYVCSCHKYDINCTNLFQFSIDTGTNAQ